MPKPRKPNPEGSLYIRWMPDKSPYSLEMRLSLIARIKTELHQAESAGVEIGGFFVGAFPSPQNPILRMDDVILVPRPAPSGTTESGGEFSLNDLPAQQLAQIQSDARSNGKVLVGVFRSHMRTTPLVPSPLDKTKLAHEFSGGVFAFLLIGQQSTLTTPREAAVFLAANGVVPDEPSTAVFPFDEIAFRSLPEVPSEEDQYRPANFSMKAPQKKPWAAIAIFALVIALVTSWLLANRVVGTFRPETNKVDLDVVASGPDLKITWDHTAPLFSNTLGASLTITDGEVRRDINLDPDDLKLGGIAYKHETDKVFVEMHLQSDGDAIPAQMFEWRAR